MPLYKGSAPHRQTQTCMHTHIHTHTHTHTHTNTNTHTHTCICACKHAHSTHTHACICMHTHIHAHTCICMHKDIHVGMHTHTQAHALEHTSACVRAHMYRFNTCSMYCWFQVLRYCKGGEPLWVSSEHQAKLEDIPDCSCGAPRQFEFQVCKDCTSKAAVPSFPSPPPPHHHMQ